jgi:hypothetical protein
MRGRIVRIAELVGEECAGNLRRKPRSDVLVILRVTLADIGARDPHVGTQRLQLQHLLGRHLVRDDEHDRIALCARDQREPEPRVAGGRLDDGAAGLQLAAALGALDHREPDAVLDRAAGILRFELQQQRAGPGIEPRNLDQRRVADQVEYRRGVLGSHR